ncbi:MAG: YhcH/YjgK/YiaL family protein [Planctomycetota bacterium]
MILDRLEHADAYAALLSTWGKALAHLRETDLLALAHGRHEVPGGGKDLFLILDRFTPRTDAGQVWESHQDYADLQVMLQGRERQGWLPRSSEPAIKTPYDRERDAEFYHPPGPGASPHWLILREGYFTVYLPNDVHAPSLRIDDSDDTPVVKAVYKLAVG